MPHPGLGQSLPVTLEFHGQSTGTRESLGRLDHNHGIQRGAVEERPGSSIFYTRGDSTFPSGATIGRRTTTHGDRGIYAHTRGLSNLRPVAATEPCDSFTRIGWQHLPVKFNLPIIVARIVRASQ